MADEIQVDKTPEQMRADQAAIDQARVADAQRVAPAVIPDDKPDGNSPQTAQAVKVEEKQLTKDEQSLETDRTIRERREGGQSDRPSPERPASDTAAARLRAFEDEHLGKDAVRINGRVERGSGSPYQALSDDKKLQYVALERLIIAEQKLEDARGIAAQAQADCEAAAKHVDECMKAAERQPDAAAAV